MKLEYTSCLHRGFYRFNVSDTGIVGFIDGYVDIEVDKRTDRISIHGTEYGSTPRVVNELTKLFNGNIDQVKKAMNR